MSKAIWIAKKNELCSVLKQVSDACGGDNIDFLREYAKEIVNNYKNDLDLPLNCFYYLFNNLYKKSNNKNKISINHGKQCIVCGYFPPFCYYHKNSVCNRS